MSIPILHGMAAAREKIAKQRALTEKTVSPESMARAPPASTSAPSCLPISM